MVNVKQNIEPARRGAVCVRAYVCAAPRACRGGQLRVRTARGEAGEDRHNHERSRSLGHSALTYRVAYAVGKLHAMELVLMGWMSSTRVAAEWGRGSG